MKAKFSPVIFIVISLFLVPGCVQKTDQKSQKRKHRPDPHSFSNSDQVRTNHMRLDLTVDFEARVLRGSCELQLERNKSCNELILDSKGLKISEVFADGKKTKWTLGDSVPFLGQAIHISLPGAAKTVQIRYETSPNAEALQWLSPEQTHDKQKPFLFSQSQAILARSWVPCQDAPAIKFTYEAIIRTPTGYMALMSAENDTTLHEDGVYHFRMQQPVSSYLLALAVGDLRFERIGRNSGVYAEPGFLSACVWELQDMQRMIDSAEALYGPYPYGRYDVLVLPPSFPFGGMENPRLTFATPTIISGDRSLVSLIAHELAHSWSGNLVTNATWNDFWLNEGFTVYFEQRIMEKIYGRDYAEMLSVLGMGELQATLRSLQQKNQWADTRLALDLDGRDPDEGLSDIAYEKGRFFLRTLEAKTGRIAFDAFLKTYFGQHAFGVITTDSFYVYLKRELLKSDERLAKDLQIHEWIYGEGLPKNCDIPQSLDLQSVEQASRLFSSNPKQLPKTANWTTHHWLHFLRNLNDQELSVEHLLQLDKKFQLTQTGNAEIACDWFKLCIRKGHRPAYEALEKYLCTIGRRKFLIPLYAELLSKEEDKELARKIFEKARPVYHSVSAISIEELLISKGV